MFWLQELIPKNEQCTGDRKKGVFDARNGPVDVEELHTRYWFLLLFCKI